MSNMWLPDGNQPGVDFTGRFGPSQVGTVYTVVYRMEGFPKYRIVSYHWLMRKTHGDGDVRYSARGLLELQRVDPMGRFDVLDSVDDSGALFDHESPLGAARDRDYALNVAKGQEFTCGDLWNPRDYETEE